jgi:nucleotide-binding universal stress UspA family protein
MYDQLLFPTDGSDGASAVFDHVLDIAAAHDSTLHVLTVADTSRDSVTRIGGDVVDALEQEGEGIVAEAAERAEMRGVSTVTEVLQGEPYSTIVDYADSRGVDLIVLPTQGRSGLERFLLGSTADRILRHAGVPVLTLRPDESIEYPYRNVLVPTDGSDCANEALRVGVEVAAADGAALHLLSVVEDAGLGLNVRTDAGVASMEGDAEGIVEEAAAFAADAGVEPASATVESGGAVHRVVGSYAEDHGIDLIVVGTHGRTGLDRYLLGSVAEKLVRTSPVPVLTVRGPGSEQ